MIKLDGQPNVINKLVGIAKSLCNEGEAGMGLFARREIAENKVICPIGGETCNENIANTSAYVIRVAANTFIDLAGKNAGYAAYVNDPLNPLLENCVIRWDETRNTYCLVANKDIEPCDEILFNYGD